MTVATPQPVLGLAAKPSGAVGITTVKIDLIVDPGQPVPAVGYLPGNPAEVVGSVAVTAAESTGVWAVSLYANADIDPAGSYYRATYVVDGIEHPPIYFLVTAGGGWVHENPYQAAATIPDGGSSGKVLAYAEILNNTTTSSTSITDLLGLTVPVGTRPFVVEFHAPVVQTNTIDKSVNFHLYDVTGSPLYIATCEVGLPLLVGSPVTFRKVFTTLPAPGVTNYMLRWAMGESGGTRTIAAAPPFLSAPAYLAAFEL